MLRKTVAHIVDDINKLMLICYGGWLTSGRNEPVYRLFCMDKHVDVLMWM